MVIEYYSFGTITVSGKTYTSDVIIYPERVDASWRRGKGHSLQVEDLTEVVEADPEVLVVGTGAYGAMKVPKETVSYLASKGIETRVEETDKAVEIFNHLGKGKVVIAALHLTC